MTKRDASTTRYAIYLRCSTDDQKQGDYTTIDTQREINRAYVEDRGGVLAGEYRDEGRSGTNLNRPGWKALLRDAEAGLFDRVCVTYMSRLGRGDACAAAEYLLRDAGVRVELVKEKFTDDTAGFVNKQVTRLVDAMYVEQVKGWTNTKMEQMVAQGYFCGGTVPYGYRTEYVTDFVRSRDRDKEKDKEPPKRLVIEEPEAEIVRLAYHVFLEKGSIAAVRDYLKKVTSRIWTTTTAKYMLANEVYVGVQAFGKWRNEEAHPAIVERATWDAVQEILTASRRRRSRQPISHDYTYYLRGLVICPHCGCPYTNGAAKGGLVRYYQCLDDTKLKTKCPVGRVNADALHKAVMAEVTRAAKHHTVMHKLIADSGGWRNPDDAKKALRGQLARKKQFNAVQINNITKAIAEGRALQSLLDTLERLEKEKETISRELELIEAEIAAQMLVRPTADVVQDAWGEILELWDEVDEDDRAELMQGLVQEVVVKEKDRVDLKLSAIPEVHGLRFVTTNKMGAGVGFEPTTFGL